jgi:hypothetical protein
MDRYLSYLSAFNKQYASIEEFTRRFEQFESKDKLIATFNSKKFKLGHNHFSDWTEDEYL